MPYDLKRSRPWVKICGITNLVDAEAAVQYGADALGFIFHQPSPRFISPMRAGEIIKRLPPQVTKVGVFVNLEVKEILVTAERCGLDLLQLHGDESPEYCREVMAAGGTVVKALRIRDEGSIAALSRYPFVSALLLDSYSREMYGGSGEKFDWTLAQKAKEYGKIILAGGLNPDNVAEAIREVEPYGVDVSSGVEKGPGLKDHGKLKAFFEAVGKKAKSL